MNIRTTLILFGLLVAVLATFGLFQLFGVKTAEERAKTSKFVFSSLNDSGKPMLATEFTKLAIDRQNPDTKQPEKLEFSHEGGQWKMTSPQQVRTDDSFVSGKSS